MSTTKNTSQPSQDEIWEKRFQELQKQNHGGHLVRSGYTVEVWHNPFVRPSGYIDLRTEEEKQEEVPF